MIYDHESIYDHNKVSINTIILNFYDYINKIIIKFKLNIIKFINKWNLDVSIQ